ncbi:hypothetical protein SAICODRAFT_7492 [Saitoella complicata NRRL Y-17804]|uniref:Ima1 N-terminal domain-containing protein n=1 Tax=Saitoella complicata (strain BCRC 22490 / CBS 7301 / JCM 7358 / NBRC 10748 / NRRL Y-17804) TaxID=698492 RepID=A0A0E9NF74_SAICN|nr:uncharacterized protein SAICODRAFT_7492 [Saitoella complicata NRRL Y-17804]ODQ52886.1 hypothetical protein SAICODRAFT_7492 [Saitoella complicata NRRL Y-17804]GAO48489.1 hypothetical protein G7K_2662-t1 [Saitoella complicata NRRL Y-17804]
MVFFRKTRSITCFYCNVTSRVEDRGPGRMKEWLCPECDAVNHYDENGNIADFVPEPKPLPPLASTSMATAPPPLSSPFCTTCTTNQALVSHTLASYLPSEDDPDYETYLSAYPAYKENLEERYPQICEMCAPKVRERLARNNYVAKASVVGGWLERSKKGEGEVEGRGRGGAVRALWTVVWVVRGVGWWVVTVVMLAWYLSGIHYPREHLASLHIPPQVLDFPTFWSSSIPLTSPTALALFRRYINTLTPYSTFVVFWNYKWLAAERIPGAKIVGTRENIKCMAVLHALRLVSSHVLGGKWVRIEDEEVYAKVSLGFLVVSIMILVVSRNVLKVQLPAKITLKDSVDIQVPSSPIAEALAESAKREPEASPTKLAQLPAEPLARSAPFNTPGFSDRNPNFTVPRSMDPILPSTDAAAEADNDIPTPFKSRPKIRTDVEPMDWNPSPPPTAKVFEQPVSNGSPFQHYRPGSNNPLPVDIVSPYGKVPIRAPGFGAQTQHQFGSPSNPFLPTPKTTKDADTTLAPQKFFAPEKPTGLEGLFGSTLQLEDEPVIVRAVKSVRRRTPWWVCILRAGVAVGCTGFVWVGVCTRMWGAVSVAGVMGLLAAATVKISDTKVVGQRVWLMEVITLLGAAFGYAYDALVGKTVFAESMGFNITSCAICVGIMVHHVIVGHTAWLVEQKVRRKKREEEMRRHRRGMGSLNMSLGLPKGMDPSASARRESLGKAQGRCGLESMFGSTVFQLAGQGTPKKASDVGVAVGVGGAGPRFGQTSSVGGSGLGFGSMNLTKRH